MKGLSYYILNAIIILLPGISGFTQEIPGKEPIYDTSFRLSVDGSHLQEIGENVYAIIHDHPTDQWPTSNTGVIIGSKYVLVVDANYLPSISRSDIQLIKKITGKPVRYLVYTHWHMDHNNGGIAYRQAFPEIDIISQRMTAEYIEINSPWYVKRELAPGSAKRQSLEQLEKEFTSGKNKDGKTLTSEELSSMDTVIHQRKNELLEFESLIVVKPNKVFETSLTLDLGNRKVVINDWGRANSPHDATIYIPGEEILFTGDILTQAPRPFTAESWPVAWVNVLKQIEKKTVKVLVLGHGPVQYNHSYTKKMREFLEADITEVKKMLSQGIPADQIPNLMNLDHLKTGVWDTGINPDPVWKNIVSALTERAVKCVRGQGGIVE